MKREKARRSANTRTVVFVPEQKLSATLLDFAAPLLEQFRPAPTVDEARGGLDLAIKIWNFHVMAGPLWGKPQFLKDARARMTDPAGEPALSAFFEILSTRRVEQFDDDPRLVGDWSLAPDDVGGFSLRCEAMLPEGCEPYVPPAPETRIRIGGRFLDEVKIAQSATALLSFPPARHRAELEGTDVVVETPASVAVQLLAEGTVPPIGTGTVELVVYGQPARRARLSRVRAPGALGRETIYLVFEPAG